MEVLELDLPGRTSRKEDVGKLCGVRCREPGCTFQYKPRFDVKIDSTWSVLEKLGGGDGELCKFFTEFPVGETLNTVQCLVHPQFPIFLVAARSLRAHYRNAHPEVSPGTCCVND